MAEKKLAYLYPHPLLALIAKKHWCVKRGGRRSLDCQWKSKIQNVGAGGGEQGWQDLFFLPDLSNTARGSSPGWKASMARSKKKKNLGMALGGVAFPRPCFFPHCVYQPLLPFLSQKLAVGLGLRPLCLHSSSPYTSLLLGRGMQDWDAWPAGNH